MLLSLAGKYNNDSVFILIRPISWHITWDVNIDLMIAATLSCYSPFYKYIVGKYINVQLISLFISMWTHEYPFYPKGYNLFLLLFTQIVSDMASVLPRYLTFSFFDTALALFEYFHTFGRIRYYRLILYFMPQLWNQLFSQGVLGTFC